jgi:hypothetical protein
MFGVWQGSADRKCIGPLCGDILGFHGEEYENGRRQSSSYFILCSIFVLLHSISYNYRR